MNTGQPNEKQLLREQKNRRRQRSLGLVSWVTALGSVVGFFGTWEAFSHTRSSATSGTTSLPVSSTDTSNYNFGSQSPSSSFSGDSSQFGAYGQSSQSPNYGGSVSLNQGPSSSTVGRSGAS